MSRRLDPIVLCSASNMITSQVARLFFAPEEMILYCGFHIWYLFFPMANVSFIVPQDAKQGLKYV